MKRLFKMMILALQVLKFEVLIRGFLLYFVTLSLSSSSWLLKLSINASH